jgi:energy-coupling factor transporter ATP-binding protein EcfA2
MKIRVENLAYTFNRKTIHAIPALKGLTFAIEEGEIIGIAGRSGSGKSCLLRCMAGVYSPTSGLIAWLPEDRDDPASHTIGLVIQDAEQQFFSGTVFDEVAFALIQSGYNRKSVESCVFQILHDLNYTGELNQSPFRLSGGEQRRVALASILVTKPRLLLLDEPTIGMDAAGVNVISGLIAQYRSQNKTILVVSHDLDFLYSEVDRFLVLDQGSLVYDFKRNDFVDYIPGLIKLGIGIPEKVRLQKRYDTPEFILRNL